MEKFHRSFDERVLSRKGEGACAKMWKSFPVTFDIQCLNPDSLRGCVKTILRVFLTLIISKIFVTENLFLFIENLPRNSSLIINQITCDKRTTIKYLSKKINRWKLNETGKYFSNLPRKKNVFSLKFSTSAPSAKLFHQQKSSEIKFVFIY